MKLIKVTEAEYAGDYKIHLTFNDGTKSTVDLEPHLWGEVFEPLKDKKVFQNFHLNPWTIEWENGADFAPEFLYELSQASKTAG